ncbi:MAG: carboxypeptidase regulatory-like domain-containing protein [Gemmatimonadota bacterium]
MRPTAFTAARHAGPFLLLTFLALSTALRAQEPPALRDHVETSSALTREHQHHASIRGTVVQGDGSPVAGATVLVLGYQPFYWSLPLARTTTDAQGRYNLADISGRGRTALWVTSPEGTPFRAQFAAITLVSGRHADLRPITLPEAKGTAEAPTTFRGRVLAKDGKPIAGALLRLMHPKESFDPSCYAITDGDGAFVIPVRTGTPKQAQLFFGNDKVEIEHAPGTEQLTDDTLRLRIDLTGERTLQHKSFAWATPKEPFPEGTEVSWSLGDAFRPCAEDRAPTREGERDNSPLYATVRAQLPGHLPRFVEMPVKGVAFASDEPRELQVVDAAGKPVPNAIVDLAEPSWRARFQEFPLGSYRTADDGTLRLRAPADREAVVYVYADGFAPGRTVWSGNAATKVVLTRRSAKLHLTLDDDVSSVFVRSAGTFDHEIVAYPRRGDVDLELAPGQYEVSRYRDGLVAAKAVTVAADARVELALDADQRPTVEIAVPEFAGEGKWWVHASRSALGGMVAKRAIWTERDGPMPTRELVAEVEAKGDRRFLLRLPTSGRYTLFVGHEQLVSRLFREVVVAFGQSYTIELPPLDGVLKGELAAFPDLWDGMPMDGVAGPRLWLEPEGTSAFGALVTLPEPKSFRLERLPRGTFTLHHHLYETGYFRSEEGTWGGAAVTIAEAAGDAGTLARGPDAELTVRVRRADGTAASGRLTIRDRMSESWQEVMRGNSTLIYASDPIPQPPSARLVDGAASLGKVRRGRLQFELLGDDGSTGFFTRDVVPGEVLEVQLGAAK